jgi:hypothetical protein
MNEPSWRFAAPVTIQSLPEDPVTPTFFILDAVIIPRSWERGYHFA